eukprot:TRINITY_DN5667_c0_g1_i1.p1 TRINITY_DN5667_c0_g1~~TRINITY_DN5667_c0_g1_i1.p1  ORF type:complete len:106 (-),score=1.74 TRINITY_DN5667_c0_g1_i1:35-352(-)
MYHSFAFFRQSLHIQTLCILKTIQVLKILHSKMNFNYLKKNSQNNLRPTTPADNRSKVIPPVPFYQSSWRNRNGLLRYRWGCRTGMGNRASHERLPSSYAWNGFR